MRQVLLTLAICLVVVSQPSAVETGDDLVAKAFPPPDYLTFRLVPPLVSQLKRGETVDIRISTRHCFGGNVYSLHVSGPGPIAVLVRGQDTLPSGVNELPFIGSVTLDSSDAVRLDRVLAFYRAGPPAWNCTASSHISASWKLTSGAKTEEWFDESCSVSDTESSLSLFSIVNRANRPDEP